jgi:hypothetical protein
VTKPQRLVFLSHVGEDGFEAGLLRYAVEHMLGHLGVSVWTYIRDQNRAERDVAGSLKARIRESSAVIFLLSPSTFETSGTQLMELAYADAFDKPIFIPLHRMRYADLSATTPGVAPLLLAAQCNDATLDWKRVIDTLGERLATGAGG